MLLQPDFCGDPGSVVASRFLRPISLLRPFLVSAGPEGVEESRFGGVS